MHPGFAVPEGRGPGIGISTKMPNTTNKKSWNLQNTKDEKKKNRGSWRVGTL